MSDQSFREIQLSGKQVIFLFMAGAVALVGTFLLGVSVGRSVTAPDIAVQASPTPAASTADAGPLGTLPPPTTPTPGELQYHDTLQGKTDAKTTLPPTPAATPSAAPASSPQPPEKPVSTPPTPPATVKPAATPAKPSATPPAAKPTPPPAASTGAVWYVQVNSFSTSANAARQVSELKAKGFTASTFNAPGSGAHYKVRVGPLDLAERDAMLARLRKEGYKPSVTR